MTTGRGPEAPTEGDEPAAFRARAVAWHERHATRHREDDLWSIPGYVDGTRAREDFDAGRAWQRKLFEHGWAGLAWPAAYGGQGGEPWMTKIFDEVARGYEEWSGFISATIAMLGPTLLRHGSEDQKRRFLPAMLSGELAFCQLFSEPGAGSDLAGLATRAVRDGDEFVVDGQKVWNSQAQFCDWGFLLARTDPDKPKHEGITFLLVDMTSPGVDVRPLVQMTGSAHFNEVFLDAVRVPVGNVVGEIDAGWGPARTVLANESAFIGSRASITTSAKLTELARMHDRLDDRVVRQGIADLYARELAQRLMNQSIQAAVRRGDAPSVDPGLVKVFATESRIRAGDLAMAITGAAGVAGEAAQSRWARHELMGRYATSIGGGTSEVMRNNISERTLGLPREPRLDRDIPWQDVPR